MDIIDPVWRPDEYDHAQLMFIPANKRAQLQCVRQGCGEIAVQKSLCTHCLSGLARNFGDVFAVRLCGEGAVGVVGGDAFE